MPHINWPARLYRFFTMFLRLKWAWVARFACLGISVGILWRVLHSVQLTAIATAFKALRPGWFLAAVLLCGVLFVPAALRWHLVLRLSDAAISPIVTFRYTLIGHFFYTILFGSIGGDSAKTALYARRFDIAFPRLLATAPVDRFLGSTIIFGLILLLVGMPHLEWKVPWRWLLAIASGVLALILLIRPWRFKPCQQFLASLLRVGKIVISHPRVLLLGISCGLLSQVALSAVLALNLAAVSPKPLPLSQMLWTFPAVVAISALPVSIGGLGTREAAGILLFGLYGVSPASAASASLLTFTTSLIWALVGAALIPVRSRPRRDERVSRIRTACALPEPGWPSRSTS